MDETVDMAKVSAQLQSLPCSVLTGATQAVGISCSAHGSHQLRGASAFFSQERPSSAPPQLPVVK